MKLYHPQEFMNSLQRSLPRTNTIQLPQSPLSTNKLNSKMSMLGNLLTLSEAKVVQPAIKKKLFKNLQISSNHQIVPNPCNLREKKVLSEAEQTSLNLPPNELNMFQRIMDTKIKKDILRFPSGMVSEENYYRSDNSVRFLIPKSPTSLIPSEYPSLENLSKNQTLKKSKSQHIVLHSIHQGQKVIQKKEKVLRNSSQESQLNTYLASIRRINESRKQQNFNVKNSGEGSSHNSTLIAQTSLPSSSTKHLYSKHFEFMDDRQTTFQQLTENSRMNQQKSELQQIIQRTKTVIIHQSNQINEQKSLIDIKDQYILQLEAKLAKYELKYGKIIA